MIVTEYRGLKNPKSAKVKEYDWNAFCWKCSHPFCYGITVNNYDKLPKDFKKSEYEKAKAEGHPIEWHESRQGIKEHNGGFVFGEIHIPDGKEIGRGKDYFPARNGITFDYEKCGDDIYSRIKNNLNEWTYCYYTTCNHNPKENDFRLRIVIPFVKTVERKLFSLATVEFAKKIGLEGIDDCCIQADRMMLYPVVIRQNENEWKDFQFWRNDGTLLDVEKYFMEKYGTLEAKELAEQIGIDWDFWSCPDLKKECREKICKVVKIGSKTVKYHNMDDYEFKPMKPKRGDVKSCFNAVFSCRDILSMQPDYQDEGERWLYVKGEGSAGVWFSDDGTRCGSHHSTDPLHNGHSWTAFDLWVFFNCDEKENFSNKLRMAHKYASESKKGEKYEKLYYYGKI